MNEYLQVTEILLIFAGENMKSCYYDTSGDWSSPTAQSSMKG